MGVFQLKTLKNKLTFILLDCILICFSIYISLLLRYDFIIPYKYLNTLGSIFLISASVNILIYYIFGLYSRLWVYSGMDDLIQIFFATITGSITQSLILLILHRAPALAVNFTTWFILFFLIGGTRISCRILKKFKIMEFKSHKKRVMVIGAGEAASILIKEMKNIPHCIYHPVIAIDDDKAKNNTQINGVNVVWGRDQIIKYSSDLRIDEIFIAIPSMPKRCLREIIDICNKTKCKLKVLPGVYNLMNEDVSIKKIRDVNIEDLLNRDEISLNIGDIARYLKDQTVMVTGGGGSIGSELCRQIASYKPKLLIVFDMYENCAYDLQNELFQKYKDKIPVKVLIGSIRDKERLEYVFSKYLPDIVFHAAAHKHVPLMEESPQEAVKNNIFGTLNLAECAVKYMVRRFVLISTDKAVNPTSIMGATKRVAEIIIQYMNTKSTTLFCAVRFGNVLGSSGSVIPLFKKQIEYGGPVAVTHPDITRYFMTIPEASSLVIQAGSMMYGGEIFVLDMGQPVKIVDLAKSLITLSGFQPYVDIDIVYTGLRPGEKLYEELLISENEVSVTNNNKIFIERPQNIDFDSFMEELKSYSKCDLNDPDIVIEIIAKLVPRYIKK